MFISSEASRTYQELINAINENGEPVCSQTDPEMWYPDKGEAVAAAKKLCNTCPIKNICLEFAIVNHETHGIWGGVGAGERRRLVKRRYS